MSAKMCKRKDVHLSTVVQNAAGGDMSKVFDKFLEDKISEIELPNNYRWSSSI